MDEEAMRRRALEIRNMNPSDVEGGAGVRGSDTLGGGATKVAVWIATEVLLAGLAI